MQKKLDPVVTGVIIVICIGVTFLIYSNLVTNKVTAKIPDSDPILDEAKEDEINNDDYDSDRIIDNEKQEDNNVPDNSTNKEFVMTCSKNTERGYEENTFTFNYNPTYNDNYITKYVIKLTIPDEFDTNDYYVSEQIMNGGRYRMSLEGRTIISEIDPTWAFWNSNDFRYKDMAYRYINKEFVEDGYNCES